MASSSSSTDIRAAKNTITLRSSDGQTFELEKAVAIQSPKLNKIITEDRPDQVIQIPSATTNTLSQVINYLKKHAAAGAPPSSLAVHGGGGGGGGRGDEEEEEEELKSWDDAFVKDAEGKKGLLDLIAAANFLEIKSLLDLLCRAVAGAIDGKSPEEIRNIFDIKEVEDVYVSPEPENEMRDFEWAYT